MTRRGMLRAALTGCAATGLAAAVAGGAPVPLPADGLRVDLDPARGIPAAGAAGASDIVGGNTTAGAKPEPWATFERTVGAHQQIFVRSFDGTRWVTEGKPQASLNINRNVDGEAPTIDFAGPDRTVPWVTWYEEVAAFGGKTQIFASHYDEPTEHWIPAGQDRGGGLPSLNVNTGRTAEDPAVAGGATTAGAPPVPWIAWQEDDGPGAGASQIFVSRGVKTAETTCAAGTVPTGSPVIGGFCWQLVGVPRMSQDSFRPSGAATDPTLNIDPTRRAEFADVAFTGPNDTVPWVVWYEEKDSGIGLRGNQLVFAAKGVADATATGGFAWKVEGARTGGQGVFPLDRSGANGIGRCGESIAAEDQCSMNTDPAGDAQDARVAAGTLTAGAATVPFVVWTESSGTGKGRIFVSRLVNGDHFELLNGGQPVSPATLDATVPDITFAGTTPWVTWRALVNGKRRAFVGHFTAGGAGFVLDTPQGIQRTRDHVGAHRIPISSDCTADPTSADGTACRGGGTGSAFLLFTNGAAGKEALFAERLAAGANRAPVARLVSLNRAGAVVRASEPGVLTVRVRQGALRATATVDVLVAGTVTVPVKGLGRFAAGPVTVRIELRDELGRTGTGGGGARLR